MLFVYKCAKLLFGTAMNEQLKCGTVGRRLGLNEAIYDMLSDERGGAMNICLTATLTSKQSLSYQHVHNALVSLAKRQPMLRATTTTAKNGDRYFDIKEIKDVVGMLNLSSSDVKSSDWKDVWFEYTNQQKGNGLLWRVVILQEEFNLDTKEYANTLMFCFNHSSTDGVSCVKFCNQFLKYLNEVANGATMDQEIRSLDILPYYHDIVTQKRTRYSILKFLLTFCHLRPVFRFVVKAMLSYYVKTIKCNPYYTQFPPSLFTSRFAGPNRLSTNVFTENETKNILQSCKVNQCTVTGALAAAANLAFCELVQDRMKESQNVKLKWEVVMNAQRHCDPKPHQDYLGYFVYDIDEFFMEYVSGTDIDFWKLAQKATKKIQDAVNAQQYVIRDTMFCETMKPKEILDLLDHDLLIRLSGCNFISSYGSFNFVTDNQQQTYKLYECFINDASLGFPGTFWHFNHTINGKMTWQITHNASRVNTQHAEMFAKLCFGRFNKIARDCV